MQFNNKLPARKRNRLIAIGIVLAAVSPVVFSAFARTDKKRSFDELVLASANIVAVTCETVTPEGGRLSTQKVEFSVKSTIWGNDLKSESKFYTRISPRHHLFTFEKNHDYILLLKKPKDQSDENYYIITGVENGIYYLEKDPKKSVFAKLKENETPTFTVDQLSTFRKNKKGITMDDMQRVVNAIHSKDKKNS